MMAPFKNASPKTRVWVKRGLWFFAFLLLLIVIFCGFFVWIIILDKPIGSATLTGTQPCSNGEYRIEVYEYTNGDGYVLLANHEGKTSEKARFIRGTIGAEARWKPDCKGVLVGSVDGMVYLEIK